jgi:16S rRNA (cytosine1402-N4)-methyltransferase
VLLSEVMECLDPRAGELVLDGTIGHAGHAQEFLRRIAPDGRLIGLDVDGAELERVALALALAPEIESGRVHLVRSSFAGVAGVLGELGLAGVDVLFADLGVSSMQIDDPRRGFSLKSDGPLDMRMDDRRARKASDVLRSIEEAALARALHELADEPDAEEIAAHLVRERERRPITTTTELVDLVLAAKRLTRHDRSTWPEERSHPAARTFQALRMLVNDELGALRELLRVAPMCLRENGRIGVLSFHSGEDRLVKSAFREGLASGAYTEVSEVVRAGAPEQHSNPRSRSAKLRWACRSASGSGTGAPD